MSAPDQHFDHWVSDFSWVFDHFQSIWKKSVAHDHPVARVWANKWRPCGAEMMIKPYKESVTWWKWKCINISLEILRMNECNHYIMEYMCQTIYCVYRVLFALPVVAVHNIYRYILKTDKWVMASCAYQHHFRGFLNWPKKTLTNLIS